MEMATQTESRTVEVGIQAGGPATAEVAIQTGGPDTAEMATQAGGPETAEMATQAGGPEMATQSGQASIQATWETAEANTQADWIEATRLGLRMSSQAHAARGQLVLFRAPTGTVVNMCQTCAFEFSEFFRQGVMWVEVKLRFEETREGPYLRQYWYLTNTCSEETPEETLVPYAYGELTTYVERHSGGITAVYSHHLTQVTTILEIGGLLYCETSTRSTGVAMDAGGAWTRLESAETLRAPLFTPQQAPDDDAADARGIDYPAPGPDDAAGPEGGDDSPAPEGADDAAGPEGGDDSPAPEGADDSASGPEGADDSPAPEGADDSPAPEGADDSASASAGYDTVDDAAAAPGDISVNGQVPSVYYIFQSTGLGDFSLRLAGLREAFAVLLAQPETANFIAVTGSMLLKNMATFNGKDAGASQQAFDELVAFTQTLTSTVTAELLEVGIHHFNLLDVVFELLLFRNLHQWTAVRVVPQAQGRFLDHLATVVQSFLPYEAWPPQALQCWALLLSEALSYLVETLSLDVWACHQPQHLAQRVFCSLECHIDQLLSVMPSA
ncbi:uncharacterized protein LOC134454117 isoform X2 [Engraulis encrasicolus]